MGSEKTVKKATAKKKSAKKSSKKATRKPAARQKAVTKFALRRIRESREAKRERAAEIMARLHVAHPDAKCALFYSNPLELLLATILSAQCTDERVNKVTPVLFKKYRKAADFASAPLVDIEEIIHSTGFFRAKARSIQECCRDIAEKHDGRVPDSLEELVELRGVGRKTANVVLGNAYGVPGVVVDTHIKRISNRLDLTRNDDPVKIEFDLMPILSRDEWVFFSHAVIFHGRRVCDARKPRCAECTLKDLCPSGADE
jgi:endonuclease-3